MNAGDGNREKRKHGETKGNHRKKEEEKNAFAACGESGERGFRAAE